MDFLPLRNILPLLNLLISLQILNGEETLKSIVSLLQLDITVDERDAKYFEKEFNAIRGSVTPTASNMKYVATVGEASGIYCVRGRSSIFCPGKTIFVCAIDTNNKNFANGVKPYEQGSKCSKCSRYSDYKYCLEGVCATLKQCSYRQLDATCTCLDTSCSKGQCKAFPKCKCEPCGQTPRPRPPPPPTRAPPPPRGKCGPSICKYPYCQTETCGCEECPDYVPCEITWCSASEVQADFDTCLCPENIGKELPLQPAYDEDDECIMAPRKCFPNWCWIKSRCRCEPCGGIPPSTPPPPPPPPPPPAPRPKPPPMTPKPKAPPTTRKPMSPPRTTRKPSPGKPQPSPSKQPIPPPPDDEGYVDESDDSYIYEDEDEYSGSTGTIRSRVFISILLYFITQFSYLYSAFC